METLKSRVTIKIFLVPSAYVHAIETVVGREFVGRPEHRGVTETVIVKMRKHE